MSNKINTPDFDKAANNYYKTPIKKKKMDFACENYKTIDNYDENNLNLNSQIISNLNYCLGDKSFENNRKTENEINNNPSCIKYFYSPFSNFLFHSPVSFQGYLNSYSRDNINVLNLLDKKRTGIAEVIRDKPGKEPEKLINNEEFEKEKIKTPFKIHSNISLIENKFNSPKPNEIANYGGYLEYKITFADKRMSSTSASGKKKKIKIIQEDKENFFQEINLNEADANKLSPQMPSSRTSPNVNTNQQNSNFITASGIKDFDNIKTPFKNLIKDLNNASNDSSFLVSNGSNNITNGLSINSNHSDIANTFMNMDNDSPTSTPAANVPANRSRKNSRCNASRKSNSEDKPVKNSTNIDKNLQSPIVIKKKILTDYKSENKADEQERNLNNLSSSLAFEREYSTPLRSSSAKKRIFECTEESTSTFNTTTKKLRMRKRLRKNSEQLEYLFDTYKNNKNWTKETVQETALKIGLDEYRVYKWFWDQKNKEYLEKKPNCIFHVQTDFQLKKSNSNMNFNV